MALDERGDGAQHRGQVGDLLGRDAAAERVHGHQNRIGSPPRHHPPRRGTVVGGRGGEQLAYRFIGEPPPRPRLRRGDVRRGAGSDDLIGHLAQERADHRQVAGGVHGDAMQRLGAGEEPRHLLAPHEQRCGRAPRDLHALAERRLEGACQPRGIGRRVGEELDVHGEHTRRHEHDRRTGGGIVLQSGGHGRDVRFPGEAGILRSPALPRGPLAPLRLSLVCHAVRRSALPVEPVIELHQ